MSEYPQIGEVIEGYAELAQDLLASWAPYLTSVSAKVGANTYGPADASADFSAWAKLVADSVFRIGSEALDALSILSSDFDEKGAVGVYDVDPQKAIVARTLALKGDLKSVTGKVLPKDRIELVPDTLVPPSTQFELVVDETGMKARTYDGYVLATDAAGAVEEIPVSWTVG